MKLTTQFGFCNAFGGLVIGTYLAWSAIDEGYALFAVAAPLAAFLAAVLFWGLLIGERDPIPTGRLVITGLLTGTFSHYLTFILLSMVMNLCYWITGGCTGSLGDPPASVMSMLIGAWAFVLFSLLIFGWITAPLSVLIGFLLRKFTGR